MSRSEWQRLGLTDRTPCPIKSGCWNFSWKQVGSVCKDWLVWRACSKIPHCHKNKEPTSTPLYWRLNSMWPLSTVVIISIWFWVFPSCWSISLPSDFQYSHHDDQYHCHKNKEPTSHPMQWSVTLGGLFQSSSSLSIIPPFVSILKNNQK